MFVYLSMGITFGFAVTVQPGPFLTYILSQTFKNGWRRTLPLALAPLISDGPIAVLVLLVLSHVPARLEQALRLAGGVLLLYLAFGAFHAWQTYTASPAQPTQPDQPGLLKAAMVNWLNPGPYLGWSLVLGPQLLQGWREAPANGIALLAGFYLTMIACLAVLIIIFGIARRLGPRINRAMIGLTAIALAGFGLYQLWLGLTTLLSFD